MEIRKEHTDITPSEIWRSVSCARHWRDQEGAGSMSLEQIRRGDFDHPDTPARRCRNRSQTVAAWPDQNDCGRWRRARRCCTSVSNDVASPGSNPGSGTPLPLTGLRQMSLPGRKNGGRFHRNTDPDPRLKMVWSETPAPPAAVRRWAICGASSRRTASSSSAIMPVFLRSIRRNTG